MGWLFPDPPPRSGARRRLWNKVYETSRDSYERTINGYEEEDARKTANAAVRGLFPTPPRGISRCPDPQPTRGRAPLMLGYFLEVHYVKSDGVVESRSFSESDKVPLLWSESLRSCFVFPYLSPGECSRLPTPAEDKLARRWAKGRGADCARPVKFPSPALGTAFPGIAITYYSDKFSHGTWQRYIHHFGPGVVCYFSRSTGSQAPTAIMCRGGRLRLEAHGLTG